MDGLDRARFPSVPGGAGHYESFYLKLADPLEPRGVWIRYTVLKRPDRPARGSLWCTLWAQPGRPPEARKVTFEADALTTGPAELIGVGASRLGSGRATGAVDGGGWELEYTANAPAFPYLPAAWMYRTKLPRTKAVSLIPYARFRGEVSVGGQSLKVDGWPGMVGHNWGAEHAERWVWLHGAGFASDSWLDVTIGRVKLGPLTLPWIANGGLWLDGRLHRLGGPGAIRATSLDEHPGRCRLVLRGRGLAVAGEVTAPPGMVAAWRYSDPAGGEHFTCNCSVASLALAVRFDDLPERSLHLPAGAAYEFGARERPAGVPVQPFPDP